MKAKPSRLIVVPIVGIYNETDNLIGEEAGGEVPVYYPYGAGVEALMGLAVQAAQKRLDNKERGE